MKKTVIKIGSIIGTGVILTTIGYSAGYYGTRMWDNWKRKNMRIIRCHHERPRIYDRSGILLVGNRQRTWEYDRVRYAVVDGKFAASLLGFTEFKNGQEIGRSGIEKMIDQKLTPGSPVYVSIDCGIQKNMEGWMERFQALGQFEYMYALCLNSQGELIATAQRPVLDINNRKQVFGGTVLFPSVFVLPISDHFMKLLGSSASAAPEEKARFRFHYKLGVLSPEARGWIRRIGKQDESLPDQAATAFNYLLAYISVAEQKPIPPLQIFSSGKQPPVVMKNKIEWITVEQGEDSITALGRAPELNGGWVYFLIHLMPERQEISQKIISEIKNF